MNEEACKPSQTKRQGSGHTARELIRRAKQATRRKHPSEEKIRILLEGIRAEISVAESKVLGGEVGFLVEKSADDGLNNLEKEHRHLLCSGIGIGAGVYSGWLKPQNLKAGRGY